MMLQHCVDVSMKPDVPEKSGELLSCVTQAEPF